MTHLISKLAVCALALSAAGVIAPAVAQDISATPTYGEVTLRAGYTPDPWSRDIEAGGSIDASNSIGGECRGMVADAPDIDLHYTAGTLPLYISVTSDADTTLVINSPDGRWHCNDDYTGLDPAVIFANPKSGLYNVWVGTFSSNSGLPDASLHISELEVTTEASLGGGTGNAGGLDYSLDPNFGSTNLEAGFIPDPFEVSIAAGGTVSVNEAVGNVCTGYANGFVSAAPDYGVNYQAGSLPLYFSGVSGSDTTLVINSPSGEWYCDDDSGDGLNPQIVFNNPQSGRYDVWIGTFSNSGDYPQSTLYVSELGLTTGLPQKGGPIGLDWTATPNYGSIELNAGFLPDPHTVGLDAGGTVDANAELGDACRGFVAEAPDYDVYYNAGEFPLYFNVSANSDTTLVVRGPDGLWYCDDDGGDGLNPQVVFTNPASGLYDVWVGTYSQSGDYPSAMLYVSEIGATDGGVSNTGDIDWMLDPSYGSTTLNGGFTPDPFSVSLSAGGSQDASSLGASCRGMIASAPDYNLTYNASSWSLFISASSSSDTTIVVNAPDGNWYCSDDYSGLNPAVEFTNPESGLYNIWVGTYSDTSNLPPATLFISELEAQF